MATGFYAWSQTAATNATADSTINWQEGQAPSTINDSARAMMAVMAKWRDDWSGTKPSNTVMTTAGSANAQTLTTNGSIAALTNGWTLTFTVGTNLQNTAACTLAVDSLAAKQIQSVTGTNLSGGELKPGSCYTVSYHQPADAWILHRGGGEFAAGTTLVAAQETAPIGWTKGATHDDKALRVVTGASGGTAGGTTPFTDIFDARTIAQANLPNVNFSNSLTAASHTHGAGSYQLISGALNVAVWQGGSGQGAQSGGSFGTTKDPTLGAAAVNNVLVTGTSSASGTFAVTGTVSSGGSGTALDFAVQYVDVILITKD